MRVAFRCLLAIAVASAACRSTGASGDWQPSASGRPPARPARRAKELPEYASLVREPNHGLPDVVGEFEASEAFIQELRNREQNLRAETTTDDAVFVTLLAKALDGVITVEPDGVNPRYTVVFTDPIHAADYAQLRLEDGPEFVYWQGSAKDLLASLHFQAADIGVPTFGVDPCPRCDATFAYDITPADSAEWLLDIWCRHHALQLCRQDTRYVFAQTAARQGYFDVARELALEAVGHGGMGDPRFHLLLGKLAVATHDSYLLGEARDFLQFLGDEPSTQALEAAVREGVVEFPEDDEPIASDAIVDSPR